MTTMEFPEGLEKQLHQMVVGLGNLLAMVPVLASTADAKRATAEGLPPEAMVDFTARLQMDVARRTLLSACASYEAATAIHRILLPKERPHA